MKRRTYLANLCFIFSIFIATLTIVLMFLGWTEQIWQTLFAIAALACSYLGAFMVKGTEPYPGSRAITVVSAVLVITIVVLLSWYYSFKSSSLLVVTILFAGFALNRSVYNVYNTYRINKGKRRNSRG